MNPTGISSSITLGGEPDGAIVGDWYSHQLTNNYDKSYTESLWMLTLNSIKYGNETIHEGQAKYASLDSYLDFIYLDQADY